MCNRIVTPLKSRWLRGSLLLGALSALSWGFFLWIPGRNVILAADLLSMLPPWQRSGPAPQNRLLTDPLWQFFPWFTELRRAVLTGHFPLWDPSMLSGVPVAANPITAFFFPLSWLVIPFGVGAGMSAMAVLRPALAAFFVYLYLRHAGRSTAASWLGAFIYGFSFPFMVWTEHPQDNVFLLAPLVLLAIDALVRNPGPRRSAVLAIAFAFVFLAGHPESAFHLFVLSAAYATVQVARYRRRRPRAIPFLALAALWSGALALFSLLPQMNVVLASEGFRHAGSHAARAMPLKMIVGFLLPKFYIAGGQHIPTADVPQNLNESACYFGIPALALAAASLAARRRVSRIPGARFWLAMLGVIAALIFVAPRFAFFERLPVLGQTFHNRLIILAGLAFAVLASEACDGLSRFSAVRAMCGAALAGMFGAMLVLPGLLAGRRAPPAQLLTAGGMIIACAAALLLKRRAGAAAVLFCAVEFVDLWHAGSRYHPLAPIDAVYPPVESSARLRAWEGRGRILPLGATFFPNSMSVYGLRDVRGYDAVESDDYRMARAGLARWVSDYGVPGEIAAELTPQDRASSQPVCRSRARASSWNGSQSLDSGGSRRAAGSCLSGIGRDDLSNRRFAGTISNHRTDRSIRRRNHRPAAGVRRGRRSGGGPVSDGRPGCPSRHSR